MPYQMVWIPPEKEINVIKELPNGTEVRGDTAFLDDGKTFKQWYKCERCEGWVEGEPDEYNEDTIGPLCGRRGTVTSCKRCGWEISFWGEQS